MPPTKLTETYGERNPLEALKPELAIQIPLTVKNGFKAIRGAVMGVITASGLIRRRSRTATAGAGFSNASAVGTVVDASVFAAGDILTTAAALAIGTIAAAGVNIVNNTVTLTGNAANNVAAGVDVIATDGSAVAQAIANEATDGVGDTVVSPYISGLLKQALLSGLDASAKTELGGRSCPQGIFKF